MKSKNIEWYLDDGNLANDYKIVLKELRRVMSIEKDLGLNLNFIKCELCFLGNLVMQHDTILQQFQKVCPGTKVTAQDQLVT